MDESISNFELTISIDFIIYKYAIALYLIQTDTVNLEVPNN